MKEKKFPVTREELRAFVSQIISDSIEDHRSSRQNKDEDYQRPIGSPTDEEIDDFIVCNPMYDHYTANNLTDHMLIGFARGIASASALRDFRVATVEWAKTTEWLAADLIPYQLEAEFSDADESLFWTPGRSSEPAWIKRSPSALLIAVDLVKSGRLLSELSWRDFEEVIGQLLEREGWRVEVTQPTKDGGIDVVATQYSQIIGPIRSVWQAKKYGLGRKVQLAQVRELSGVLEKSEATKGIIVTTSRLTRGSLDWIRQDIYRLGFKDKEQVEEWIKRHA